MATRKGLEIVSHINEKRCDEICEYVWSLNFKKDVMVDIFVGDRAPGIQAKVTRTRYFIYVNPETELEDIKNFLIQKGYIVEE